MKLTDALYDMARKYYNNGYFDQQVRDILMKDKRTKEDDAILVQYALDCQERHMLRKKETLSIRQMKETVADLIGAPSLKHGYGTTVSKDDMVSIYNFITSLPREFLAEDKYPIGE